MFLRQFQGCLFFQWNAVEPVLQNGVDGAVGDAMDHDGTVASGLEAFR